MDRAALLVGIDHYPSRPLSGCVADADALAKLLQRHHNGDPNFHCTTLVSSPQTRVTRSKLRSATRALFSNAAVDFALFYFAGHGARFDDLGGYLVTQDHDRHDEGVGMGDIITLANNCRARERVIILDCCHAGAIDDMMASGATMPLAKGVVLLMGCGAQEVSREAAGRGVFTRYLCDALAGGAADVQGYVTVGDAYSYLNQVLDLDEQHPALHANLSRLRPLRRAAAAVPDTRLREIPRLFPREDHEIALDPSWEASSTNPDPARCDDMRILQQLRSTRLVEPIGTDHMFHAAMNNLSCRLTALGQFYWRKVDNGLV